VSEAAAGQPARVSGRAWWTLGVLLFLCILSLMDRAILSLVVQPVKVDFGLSDVQMGLLQGVAFALLYSTATIPAGMAVDRWSPRVVAFLGVGAWSLSTMMCGLAHSFGALFVGRLGVGMGEATLQPAAFALMGRLFPRHRLGLASGIYMIGTLMGGGVALIFGGLVVEAISRSHTLILPVFGVLKPWQAAFILLGAPGLVLSLLAFTLSSPPRTRAAPVAASREVWPFLRRHGLMVGCHLLAFSLLGTCAYASSAWAPAYFARAFGWSVGRSGPMLGIVLAVVAVAGTLLCGAVADRLYAGGLKDAHVRVHVWLTLAGLPFGVAAYLVDNPYLCLVLLALAYLTLFSFGGTATAVLQLIAPQHLRGRLASGYAMVMGLVGGGLGPLIAALFGEHLFGGDAGIGRGVALTIAIFTPVALMLLVLNLARYRAALQEAEDHVAAETT
jgi:MFS family permease